MLEKRSATYREHNFILQIDDGSFWYLNCFAINVLPRVVAGVIRTWREAPLSDKIWEGASPTSAESG